MNKLFLIIDQNQHLYELLKELKFDEQYELILVDNNIKEQIDSIILQKFEYLILTDKSNYSEQKAISINKPIKISQLYEKINLFFSKNKFQISSNISVGKYHIDLNSRNIILNKKNLKLTEKELELIMYLFNSKQEKSSSDISKNVWGHTIGVETHTVETHIYRLRKKIVNKFQDDKFIISSDNGYKI